MQAQAQAQAQAASWLGRAPVRVDAQAAQPEVLGELVAVRVEPLTAAERGPLMAAGRGPRPALRSSAR